MLLPQIKIRKNKFWQSGDQNISCICELLFESPFLFVHHYLIKFGGLPEALTLCMRSGEAVIIENVLGLDFTGNRKSIRFII